jgi:hypothetical protein
MSNKQRRITDNGVSTAMPTPTPAEAAAALDTLLAFDAANGETLDATDKALTANHAAKQELAAVQAELAQATDAHAIAKRGLTKEQFASVQEYDKHLRDARVELQTCEEALPAAAATLEAATVAHAKADAKHKKLEAVIEDFRQRVAAA